MTLVDRESSPSPVTPKAGYGHSIVDYTAPAHAPDSYTFEPAPSVDSRASSEARLLF